MAIEALANTRVSAFSYKRDACVYSNIPELSPYWLDRLTASSLIAHRYKYTPAFEKGAEHFVFPYFLHKRGVQ